MSVYVVCAMCTFVISSFQYTLIEIHRSVSSVTSSSVYSIILNHCVFVCERERRREEGRGGREGGREEGRKGGREGGREIEIEMICCVGRSSVHTIRTVSTSAIHSVRWWMSAITASIPFPSILTVHELHS